MPTNVDEELVDLAAATLLAAAGRRVLAETLLVRHDGRERRPTLERTQDLIAAAHLSKLEFHGLAKHIFKRQGVSYHVAGTNDQCLCGQCYDDNGRPRSEEAPRATVTVH